MFSTIHSDQAIKVLFDVLICYLGFQQSFWRKSACPDGIQEIKKCLGVFSMMVGSNSSPKGKSLKIFTKADASYGS